MALFGSSKVEEKKVETKAEEVKKEGGSTGSSKSNAITATIITPGTEITGDIKSNDTIHVDGILNGDVMADNMIVVGKSGVIFGNIKAEKVIVSGKIKGNILCADLEVMKSGNILQRIDADRLIVDGSIEGEVLAKTSVNILKDGKLKVTLLKTKRARVNGSIEGKIVATELLEVNRDGVVQGEIVVKNIRTEEGSRMIGSMSTYQELTKESEPSITPLKKENSRTDPETETEAENKTAK